MIDKKNIKEDVKRILNDFSNKMKNSSKNFKYEKIRSKCFREDDNPKKSDENFINRFLKNAKKTNDRYVMADVGEWEK